ncbi:MAG: helix-turn-helix domain-containing protein [Rhodobacteraceae bacterium]|jgi:AraC-like DNA-binding protein|nr:helix-turn-helix domain-containing protein [Paracoccaceae bacterium]
MRTLFNTAEVAEAHRFEYWHDLVCNQFVSADSANKSDSPFDAAIVSQDMGRISLSRMQAPKHTWKRAMKHVRSDDDEHYLLGIVAKGTGVLEQIGRVTQQTAGDIAVYDTAMPFSYALSAEINLVKIPHRFLDARALCIRDYLARNLATDRNLSRILADMTNSCVALDLTFSAQALVGERLSESLIDLLLAVIDLHHEANGGAGGGYDSFDRIRSYALSNLGDSEMSPQHLAQAGRVSTRTLNRIFVKMGTTPMRWLQGERLRMAEVHLREATVKSVTEAAFLVGFNDLAHFSRSFKSCFGYTPEQVLYRR